MLLLFQVCLVLLQDFDTIPVLWGKYLERERERKKTHLKLGYWIMIEPRIASHLAYKVKQVITFFKQNF